MKIVFISWRKLYHIRPFLASGTTAASKPPRRVKDNAPYHCGCGKMVGRLVLKPPRRVRDNAPYHNRNSFC